MRWRIKESCVYPFCCTPRRSWRTFRCFRADGGRRPRSTSWCLQSCICRPRNTEGTDDQSFSIQRLLSLILFSYEFCSLLDVLWTVDLARIQCSLAQRRVRRHAMTIGIRAFVVQYYDKLLRYEMSQFLLGKPTASEIKAAILKCNGIKLDRTQHVDVMKVNYHPLRFFISKLRVFNRKNGITNYVF